MDKPPYYAPLLAVAARLESYGPLNSQLCELYTYSFFKQFTPAAGSALPAQAHLLEAHSWAQLITSGPVPAAGLVSCAAQSIAAGARALFAGLGYLGHATDEMLRREMGRLVVKHALPHALGFYAAGAVGDFSVHRIPLATYKPGLHIGAAEIATDATIASALRQTRYRRAHEVRQYVQGEPRLAIRCQATGAPVAKFKAAHWAQLTHRLGYTTFFDVVAQAHRAADNDASLAPAPTELVQALHTLTSYCYAVFSAYLAGVTPAKATPELALVA